MAERTETSKWYTRKNLLPSIFFLGAGLAVGGISTRIYDKNEMDSAEIAQQIIEETNDKLKKAEHAKLEADIVNIEVILDSTRKNLSACEEESLQTEKKLQNCSTEKSQSDTQMAACKQDKEGLAQKLKTSEQEKIQALTAETSALLAKNDALKREKEALTKMNEEKKIKEKAIEVMNKTVEIMKNMAKKLARCL